MLIVIFGMKDFHNGLQQEQVILSEWLHACVIKFPFNNELFRKTNIKLVYNAEFFKLGNQLMTFIENYY
ncbi:hypothetical protein HAT91_02055 [Dickeya solani]|nr:hypothetical protein HAT91_02055 [Dickeya solani]